MPNKYAPHVFVLPEDAACRDIANGFVRGVANPRAIRVEKPANGWVDVKDCLSRDRFDLKTTEKRRLVIVVDFDNDTSRADDIMNACPQCVRDRVYVIGPRGQVEELRSKLVDEGIVKPNTLEQIGVRLAEDCSSKDYRLWEDDLLKHNEPVLQRMLKDLRPILFDP